MMLLSGRGTELCELLETDFELSMFSLRNIKKENFRGKTKNMCGK